MNKTRYNKSEVIQNLLLIMLMIPTLTECLQNLVVQITILQRSQNSRVIQIKKSKLTILESLL